MSTNTSRLQLLKPAASDNVDVVSDLSDNFQTIDDYLPNYICTSTTRPPSPFTGMVIFETDTGDVRLYTGSAWVIISHTGADKSYTPVVGGSGAWTLGDGSISGKYIKIGRHIQGYILWTIGAGGGTDATWNPTVTLPEPVPAGRKLLVSDALYAHSGAVYHIYGYNGGGNSSLGLYVPPTTAQGSINYFRQGNPYTVSAGDQIAISFDYETTTD